MVKQRILQLIAATTGLHAMFAQAPKEVGSPSYFLTPVPLVALVEEDGETLIYGVDLCDDYFTVLCIEESNNFLGLVLGTTAPEWTEGAAEFYLSNQARQKKVTPIVPVPNTLDTPGSSALVHPTRSA